MTQVLIIHGAGMNMRGKVQTEIFGTMTLPEYDEHIRKYAAELGIEVETFHSNIVGEVINKFYEAHDRGVDAALINPAGYSTGKPALVAAIFCGYPSRNEGQSSPLTASRPITEATSWMESRAKGWWGGRTTTAACSSGGRIRR